MSLIETIGPGNASVREASIAGQFHAPHSYRRHSQPSVVVAQTSPHRIDFCKSLTIRSPERDDLVITHMRRSKPDHGMTESQARVEAYTACVHLDDFTTYDVWCDERHNSSRALGAGTIHINDMRQVWRADIRSPFQVVNFHIPQWALDDISDEHGAPPVEELHCPMNLARVDEVFRNLALALLPALARSDQTNRLFVDHAARAVTTHLARTYGSLRLQTTPDRGGLAPWQVRRAKDLLCADLSANLGLAELAGACRLSVSRFSQAFRQTVGCPPHQWLMMQRVERAKELILNTDQSLSEIALAIGFADQSHFTRVFSQRVKASPAAWRRAQER
jgi:AraC family transcriptional regulator